jgi:phage-related minor tail protein
MDKNENSSNQHQGIRCEICGGEIVDGICSECNWVPIIFPQGVPDSIKSFDSKRKEAAKKHQSDIAQLKSERDAASVRARDLETEVAKLKTDLSQAQEEVRNAQSKIQEINATNSNKLDSEISDLKSSLAQAKQEIHDAQLQNQRLTQEKEKLQAELEQVKKSNTSGVQIRIDKNDCGQYVLYVIAGVAQRSNGREIGQSGMELHDPSFFRIGELSFKVEFREDID